MLSHKSAFCSRVFLRGKELLSFGGLLQRIKQHLLCTFERFKCLYDLLFFLFGHHAYTVIMLL